MSGDCIRCPFHDWKFEGNTGTCVEVVVIKDDFNDHVFDNCFDDGNQVPYDQTSKIPGKAKVETFTCLERNHLVMVSSIIKVTVTVAGADQ